MYHLSFRDTHFVADKQKQNNPIKGFIINPSILLSLKILEY